MQNIVQSFKKSDCFWRKDIKSGVKAMRSSNHSMKYTQFKDQQLGKYATFILETAATFKINN